jgi:hypothetical protein
MPYIEDHAMALGDGPLIEGFRFKYVKKVIALLSRSLKFRPQTGRCFLQ